MPNDASFDPEATSAVANEALSSDIRLSDHENAQVGTGTHIATFEIEMGDGHQHDTTANGTSHDQNENNMNHTDISEIPSIMTAPSMDDSLDEDIVEMESLLRSNRDKKEKNRSKNSKGPTTKDVADHVENQTMNDGTTASGSDSQSNKKKRGSYYCLPCCNGTATTAVATKPYRMGNIQVVYPPIYIRTNGWFVFGPHWFGPPFILFIVLISSYYIIYVRCYQRHWYLTTMMCSLLCGSTVYHLLNTAYRDPGVILKHSLPINHNDPASIPRSYRYCDACQYYQPSHAAHCPDCNVCVAGFDHHCVWMSICIGVGNYKVTLFKRWLLFFKLEHFTYRKLSFFVQKAVYAVQPILVSVCRLCHSMGCRHCTDL